MTCNFLPDEILSHVASFLVHDDQSRGAFARVSRRFCAVAHDTFDQGPALRHACRRGYNDVVELLLADGRADPTAEKNYAIVRSSINGNADIVKLLLADGRADPAARNNYAIQWSSQKGHADVVRLLLADAHVDSTTTNNLAIRMSCEMDIQTS